MTDPMLVASATLTAYNHATNIVNSLFDTAIDMAMQEKLGVLLRELSAMLESNIELNKKLAACQAEKNELISKMNRAEDWDRQKARYRLYSPWSGAIVYAFAKAMSGEEPPHWLCATCFEEKKRSFLNARRNKDTGYEEFFCQAGHVILSRHRGQNVIDYYPEASG